MVKWVCGSVTLDTSVANVVFGHSEYYMGCVSDSMMLGRLLVEFGPELIVVPCRSDMYVGWPGPWTLHLCGNLYGTAFELRYRHHAGPGMLL